MRYVGRILVVLGLLTGPTVVMLFGCNDNQHLPPLPNELPNQGGTPVGVPTGTSTSGTTTTSSGTTTTGTTTTTTTTTTATFGPALSECDCAQALFTGSAACKACEKASCNLEMQVCAAPSSDCPAATLQMGTCAGAGACVSLVIETHPNYGTLINCLFQNCASSCGVAAPLSCTLSTDGGTNG